jgi:hypothetical protein
MRRARRSIEAAVRDGMDVINVSPGTEIDRVATWW